MTTRQFNRYKGVSLVEVMSAIVVIVIAVLGFSSYRYHSALDARTADLHMTAGRIGLLIYESWRGVNGKETYDPITAEFGSDLPITTSDNDGHEPDDFTLLGTYKIVLNRANYYATLSWKDVSTGLKALNVTVAWAQRNQGETDIDDTDKTIEYTTYAIR